MATVSIFKTKQILILIGNYSFYVKKKSLQLCLIYLYIEMFEVMSLKVKLSERPICREKQSAFIVKYDNFLYMKHDTYTLQLPIRKCLSFKQLSD